MLAEKEKQIKAENQKQMAVKERHIQSLEADNDRLRKDNVIVRNKNKEWFYNNSDKSMAIHKKSEDKEREFKLKVGELECRITRLQNECDSYKNKLSAKQSDYEDVLTENMNLTGKNIQFCVKVEDLTKKLVHARSEVKESLLLTIKNSSRENKRIKESTCQLMKIADDRAAKALLISELLKIGNDCVEKLECQDAQMNSKDMEILALKNDLKTKESLVEQADELFFLRLQRSENQPEATKSPVKKIKREAI